MCWLFLCCVLLAASMRWLKFLAWEEFDEEIWGEGLRPNYIENSIKFTPQVLVTLNSKLTIKTVSSFISVCNLIMFINTYFIMFLLVFSPRCLYLFFHIRRLGGLVSSFYRWIGSQGTFPTFSLSLIVNWWKFLSTLFHQFIFDTEIYKKSGQSPFYMDRSGNFV